MWDRIRQWLGGASAGAPAVQAQKALSSSEQQALAAQLAQWPAMMQAGAQGLRQQAVVVFDLETTGLDLKRDTILSIGGVRLEPDAGGQGLGIALGQTWERVLAVQVQLKPDSQLFHGMTQADLARGQDPRQALLELLDWGRDAIWLAWHAWFDETMLHRAAQQWLGLTAQGGRLPKVYDLAHAMPLLFPEHAALGADLDAWLRALRLGNSERHHAVADAMATAELALVALARAQALGMATWGELIAAMARAEQQRRAQQHAGL
ncbi:MAG: 3'-5' exonuclease [Comamonadaceae bacterium]|nr:3'-5' exonuclease [Comamonadaceae bacterium]